MTWQCEARLAQWNYRNADERSAYRVGYTAGYHNKEQAQSHPFPNAYSKGYWEGKGDNPNFKLGNNRKTRRAWFSKRKNVNGKDVSRWNAQCGLFW